MSIENEKSGNAHKSIVRFNEIPHQCIERASRGDNHALEELCLMVQPGVYSVLMALLRNGDDAADAAQESLIRMIRFLPDLRTPAAFSGWMMRLLVNQAAGSRRRVTPVVDVTELADSADASMHVQPTATTPLSPRRAAENHEISRLIQVAIAALPERQRTALVLFELEDMTTREVAEAMALSDGAVKFHIHEARKNIRHHLQNAGVLSATLFEETRQ